MGSNLISQLAIVDNFGYSLRNFFGPIVKFIYYLIAQAVDLMYQLAGSHFGLDNEIDSFIKSIYFILIIFMIFKLTIALLNYIINPDSFFDKSSGFGKFIIRILISIVLLASINPIFRLLYNIQDDIIQNNTVENVILGNNSAGVTISDGNGTINDVIYKIRMDDNCPEGYYIYSFSKGESLSVLVLQPFYTLNAPTQADLESEDSETSQLAENMDTAINDYKANGYCGYKLPEDNKLSLDAYDAFKNKGISSASNLLEPYIYTFMVDDKKDQSVLKELACSVASDYMVASTTANFAPARVVSNIPVVKKNFKSWAYSHCRKTIATVDKITGHEEYVVNFSYFWALIFGIVIFLLLISYCFDVVIRAFTLFFYQLIAPIPIIMNMSPNKKDADVLTNWAKKVVGCWASLFIRLAVLDLVIYLIMVIRTSDVIEGETGLIAQLFIIIGALMFAKKLPGLIEEVIPGLKLGGLKLNPFKRVKEEALGGSLITGAGAAALGLGVSGIAQAGSNAVAFGRERSLLRKQIDDARAKGDMDKVNKLQHRLDHMNGVRLAQTTSGGLFGGMRRGVVSGFKTGHSGSANVIKNLPKDLREGNLARNTRSAIRTFNNDLNDAASDKIAQATADYNSEYNNILNDYVNGTYGAYGSANAMAERDRRLSAARQTYDGSVRSAQKDVDDQKYTWFDRNVIERLDRNVGVRNTTGGYGYYDDKIEKLTQNIENKHQQEITLRQSVTNKMTNDNQLKLDAHMFEELRYNMAEKNIAFNDYASLTANADFNNIVRDMSTKYGIALADIENDYNRYRGDLNAITSLDVEQKELKAERKGYKEMMEARKAAQEKK